MGRACYAAGGCPTDYIAAILTGVTCAWLAATVAYVVQNRQFTPLRAKHVPLVTVGAASSIVWLVSMVVSQGLFKVPSESFLNSCTLWKVWLGGLLGFGLWISCHIARGFRLYFIFVRKQYPPCPAHWVVVILLIPWLAVALAFQFGDALNNESDRCTAPLRWYVPLAVIHGVYVLLFLGATLSVRGIHFMFNEYRDQKRTAAAMIVFIGIWLILWLSKRIAGDSAQRLQVAVRFTLIIAADAAAVLFFWMPVQAPVRRLLWRAGGLNAPEGFKEALPRDHIALTMGPILTEKMLEAESLETLLGFPKFLEAFKEFADSRLAGECVHFFEAVQKRLDPGHVASPEARIYAADDIIAKFVRAGAPMQINISSAMRSRILRQKDLAAEDLFREASREAMNIMQTNLEKDFQRSPQYAILKAALAQEASESNQLRLMGISEISTFEQLARLGAVSERPPVEKPSGELKPGAFDGRGTSSKVAKAISPVVRGLEKIYDGLGGSDAGVSEGGDDRNSSRKRLWAPVEERSDDVGVSNTTGTFRGSASSPVPTMGPSAMDPAAAPMGQRLLDAPTSHLHSETTLEMDSTGEEPLLQQPSSAEPPPNARFLSETRLETNPSGDEEALPLRNPRGSSPGTSWGPVTSTGEASGSQGLIERRRRSSEPWVSPNKDGNPELEKATGENATGEEPLLRPRRFSDPPSSPRSPREKGVGSQGLSGLRVS